MSLELDPATKTVVKMRPFTIPACRGRIESQLSSESDFFEQLLRFQNQEGFESSLSIPQPASDPTLDGTQSTNEIADRDTDDKADPESKETPEVDNEASVITSVSPQGERPIDRSEILSKDAKEKSTEDRQSRITSDTEDEGDNLREQNELVVATVKDSSNRSNAGSHNSDPLSGKNREKPRTDSAPVTNPEASQKKARQEGTQSSQGSIAADRSPDNNRVRGSEPDPREIQETAKSRNVVADEAVEFDDVSAKPDNLQSARGTRIEPVQQPQGKQPTNINPEIATPQVIAKNPVSTNTSTKEPKAFDPEIASSSNNESSRTRRRSERNASRNRTNADGSRESTDRPSSSERNGNTRSEITPASHSREATTARIGDNTANPVNIPPMAISPGIPAAANPTPASPPVFLSGSPTTTSPETRSIQGSSQNSPNGQSTTAVPSSASTSSPTIQSPAATASAGSTGPKLTQYQETKLLQRVLRGMEQLSNGGGQVRLRLHPPELGSLQMSLRIEGNTVFAEMQVETTSARDTLMKNLPVLKERLAEQGMQVERFDVRTDGNFDNGNFNTSSQSSQGGNESGSERQSSRYISELRNRLSMPEMAFGPEPIRRWTRTQGQLDFEA